VTFSKALPHFFRTRGLVCVCVQCYCRIYNETRQAATHITVLCICRLSLLKAGSVGGDIFSLCQSKATIHFGILQ
jgi:hypothetical protein